MTQFVPLGGTYRFSFEYKDISAAFTALTVATIKKKTKFHDFIKYFKMKFFKH